MFSRIRLCRPAAVPAGFSDKLFKNNFYYALVYIFNRVSESRIKEVGPDRACAEWLMRNGALVRWTDESTYVTSYNALPLDKSSTHRRYLIKEVDATDAAISYHGFPYFSGCNYIDKIKLVNCYYIDDKALNLLDYLKNSLQYLEVISCSDVTNKGLEALPRLVNLKTLKLGHLKHVKNLDRTVAELMKSLPNTEITTVR